MDRKKLDRLWQDVEAARRKPHRSGDLDDLARRCGRELRTGGKHPVWVCTEFPHRPFPVPRHGNRDISPGVKNVVLDLIEADLAAWEERIQKAEQKRELEQKRIESKNEPSGR
jgi:hypothetical protein